MGEVVALVVGIVNLILLLWFIITLNGIKSDTAEIVEFGRLLVKRTVPAANPNVSINDGMTPDEMLAAVEAAGGQLKLLNDVMGLDVVLENHDAMPPELVRLVKKHSKAIAKVVRRRR
ncbi:MAG: hypothetical protein WBC44_02105 [Planctomycetaceae bacterium]